MTKRDDPIGAIPCPLCKRAAEVVKFNERTKLDPAGGEGKAAYPRKVYLVCPPITGYRGCGTILANSLEAQARIMETAEIFGASGAPASKPAPIAAPPSPPIVPNKPPAPEKKRSTFDLW